MTVAGGEIPFSLLLLVRITGMMAAMLVLVWVLHFRGGMALISDDQGIIRNAHPVLMLVGLILLNGEAMLVYKTALGTKNYKKVLHLVLQAFALALGVTGIWAAYKFRNVEGISGFYSLHSWLGLACILLFGIQVVGISGPIGLLGLLRFGTQGLEELGDILYYHGMHFWGFTFMDWLCQLQRLDF